MRTIHKYKLRPEGRLCVEMPRGAQVLTVQAQCEDPCLWALVDTTEPNELRWFELRGTGHDCEGLSAESHVGTFQLSNGELVYHLFECPIN